MKVFHNEGGIGTMQRRLVARVGRVEAIHPNGHLALKTACIETTIMVYGGMSGGPVSKFQNSSAPIKPFGFVSYAPFSESLLDRSQNGHSLGALLNAKITPLATKQQGIEMRMNALLTRP
jgi:hypothetical protein